MTENKKAIELIKMFDEVTEYLLPKRYAIKCTLITVNEIIKTNPRLPVMVQWDKVRDELIKQNNNF